MKTKSEIELALKIKFDRGLQDLHSISDLADFILSLMLHTPPTPPVEYEHDPQESCDENWYCTKCHQIIDVDGDWGKCSVPNPTPPVSEDKECDCPECGLSVNYEDWCCIGQIPTGNKKLFAGGPCNGKSTYVETMAKINGIKVTHPTSPVERVSEDKTVEGKIEKITEHWTPKDMENGCINEVSKKVNELVDVINSLRKEK